MTSKAAFEKIRPFAYESAWALIAGIPEMVSVFDWAKLAKKCKKTLWEYHLRDEERAEIEKGTLVPFAVVNLDGAAGGVPEGYAEVSGHGVLFFDSTSAAAADCPVLHIGEKLSGRVVKSGPVPPYRRKVAERVDDLRLILAEAPSFLGNEALAVIVGSVPQSFRRLMMKVDDYVADNRLEEPRGTINPNDVLRSLGVHEPTRRGDVYTIIEANVRW